jgi:DNA-binding MarR family transcriptional regulator
MNIILRRTKKRDMFLRKVFEALRDPKTPTQLAKELEINLGYISNILISLIDRELVECLNPGEKRHRLYRWSGKGKDLFNSMFADKKGQII